jgi:hypothetical protein
MAKVQVAVVWINAAVFLLYGIGFVLFPESLSAFVTGNVPGGSSALIDLRATYGGMSIGLGILLGLLALNPAWVRAGLLGVLVIMLGMASARLYGIAVDGTPNRIMLVYLAAEVAMVCVAFWALKSSK